MSDIYNIDLIKGSSLTIRVIAKDSNDSPIDLNGYTVSGYVRHRYSDTNYLTTLSPTITAPASGVVDIAITHTQSSLLPIMQGVYDVEVYNGSSVFKVVRGYLNVFPETTY